MNILPLVDHSGSIASIVSLPAAVIAMVAWLQSGTGRARKVILTFAFLVAVAAYGIDISDRLGWARFSERPFSCNVIEDYGLRDAALYMTVDSSSLLDYKDNFKMMLISIIPYADIDRMTDTNIEKSALYTITEGVTRLAITSVAHLHLVAPPGFTSGTVKLMTFFYLVLLPNNVAPEQVRSLSDVTRVGGKIIDGRGTYAEYQGTPAKQPK